MCSGLATGRESIRQAASRKPQAAQVLGPALSLVNLSFAGRLGEHRNRSGCGLLLANHSDGGSLARFVL